jgi:hypothetical protein
MSESTLAIAIERKRWDVVALVLLVALADVLTRIPPHTLERMLDLLEAHE